MEKLHETSETPGNPENANHSKLSKRKMKKMAKAAAIAEKRREWSQRQREKRKSRKRPTSNKTNTPIMRMAQSSCQLRVVLDLSWSSLMSERDARKCAKQIAACYSVNRRAPNPLQFHLCSFFGPSKDILAQMHPGHSQWDVHFHQQPYNICFPTTDIVYLTSDSEHELDTLDVDKAYVIGALVDHNAHKGVCLTNAKEAGVSHARLPLKKHVCLLGRSVLTVNHVFEILLMKSAGASWGDCFRRVVPKRKLAEEGSCGNIFKVDGENSETNNEHTAVSGTVIRVPNSGTGG